MQNLSRSPDGQTASASPLRGQNVGNIKTVKCPAGYVMTGVNGQQGSMIDRISAIYCKAITNIGSSTDTYVPVKAGGTGGTGITIKCPNGSAIDYMSAGVNNDSGITRPVNAIFGCKKYNSDGSSVRTADMRIGQGSSSWWARQDPATQYWYADGIDVIADNYVAGLGIEARNFSKELDARTNPVESAKCAVGTRTVNCNDISPGSADATMFMSGYCGTPSNSPTAECKIWCKQNPQYCDAAVTEYCIVNPNDPYCSCINSPAQGIAKCVDGTCLTSGYVPTNMLNVKCPDVVNCNVQAAMANAGRAISQSIPVQQNCGNTTIDPGVGTGSNTNNNGTTNPSTPATSSSSYMMQIIIVLIFLVTIVVLVAFAYSRFGRRSSIVP